MSHPLFQQRCSATLSTLRRELPGRTPALLVTLFGDVVAAHGGEIWLGSLIRMLAALGIGERLVRTSVYRLAKDGWLRGAFLGRRRYYQLGKEALSDTARFEQRIYHPPQRQWNGQWRLVFTGTQGIDAEQRTALRKRLGWIGFGSIAPNVFAHPDAPLEPLWELFEQTGVSDQVVVMRAENYDRMHGLDSLEMARQCFRLDRLEGDYQRFISRYAPLAETLVGGSAPVDADPEQCFALRTLLIHHYRLILLKDPDLPPTLLPEQWPGLRAQQLCGSIYRAIDSTAERHILALGENRKGPFEGTSKQYRRRFSR